MNACIIGDGLTSLALAKTLINKKINVHIYHEKIIEKLASNRTIGIASKNLEFFEKEIFKFKKKDIWPIRKIEIYTEKIKDDKILTFEKNNKNLFYMIRNNQLYKSLNKELLKSKFFKKLVMKKNNSYEKFLKKNKYDIIINCDPNNFISKKYFSKKIEKDYQNIAYASILEHEKIKNKTAIQIFTKFGPIAFLPISNTETSIVCSLEVKEKQYNDKEVLNLINEKNPKFKIKKILKLQNFKLKSSHLRNYYFQNILAFGDTLHKIHPLAGQGFNMTIRDIKVLSKIIQNKIDFGIQLDSSIFKEFEQKTKHINFIFSNGVDFIYEFFNFDKRIKNKNLNKILRLLGKNKDITKTFIRFADDGFNI